MPRRVQAPDGLTHLFPDDATDQEISEALETPPSTARGNPERSWSPSPVPRDARGMPIVSSETSDSPAEPSGLGAMLEPLAHPETLMDFARLLTLPVDSVRKALAGALTMRSAQPAASGALTKGGQAVERTGEALDNVTTKTIGAYELMRHPIAGGAVLVGPTLVKGAGRAMQKAGTALAPKAADAAKAAPAVAEASPAIAETAPVGNALPNQKLLNELAIAARRAKVKLTPETEAAAIKAVGEGASPAEAVARVSPSSAPVATPKPVAAPDGMRLNAAEFKEFQRLLGRGMKAPEAMEKVRAMRELATRLGGATTSEATKAVAQRNTTGKW